MVKILLLVGIALMCAIAASPKREVVSHLELGQPAELLVSLSTPYLVVPLILCLLAYGWLAKSLWHWVGVWLACWIGLSVGLFSVPVGPNETVFIGWLAPVATFVPTFYAVSIALAGSIARTGYEKLSMRRTATPN